MTTSVLSGGSAAPKRFIAFPGAARDLHGRVRRAILGVPLLGKLIGVNLVILLVALAAHFVFPATPTVAELTALLLVSLGITAPLARLALRPLVQLEETAERVARGDYAARVPSSTLADRDMTKLVATVNRLLERVQDDRARIQYLAGRSVRARDIEREAIARELRDSLAQMVAAIAMQIAAARTSNTDASQDQRLEEANVLIQQLADEMRSVAETLYPGTLGEFGLLNALGARARLVARQSGIPIEVESTPFDLSLSASAAAALYRVADEALRNVAQHSHAKHARVLLRPGTYEVWLEIEDDGRGIDMTKSDPVQAGLGLFSAKAVLALAGGELQISSAPGRGTRVVARVPVTDRPDTP